MTAYPWTILAAALLVAPVATAAAAPPTQQVTNTFVLHKTQGDTFRLAGRMSEALSSYEQALAIRYDPEVAGRTGVIWFAAGDFDIAANLLHRALNDTSTSLSAKDRLDFLKVYSDALPKVCHADIRVDHLGARVEIDHIERTEVHADSRLYLMPGDHVIRTRLQGFHDTIGGFVAEPGKQITLTILMQRIVDVRASAVITTATVEEQKAKHNSPSLYGDNPPTDRGKTSTNGRFVAGFGTWIPFGAAPGMGVGGQLHGAWRSKSWWEIGLEVRAAWTVGIDGIEAGSAYAWAVTAAPCGRIREHFFGCVLLQVSGGALLAADSWTLPGAGVRAGYEFHLNNRFSLGLFGDVAVRFGAPTLGPGKSLVWTGKLLVPAIGANVLTFF